MISIRERPASVEDRAVPGHWEGDLLCGSANSYIVDPGRATHTLRAAGQGREPRQPIGDHGADRAGEAAAATSSCKSLTWDRGKEMAQHKRFTLATDVAVYFCDPQSRGSAAPTRTPTACFGSTSRRAPTSACTRRNGWTRSRGSLMDDRARRSGSKHQPSDLKRVLR